MTNKHIIFDFDGVICNSFNTMVDAHNYAKKHRFNSLPFVTKESRFLDYKPNYFQLKLEDYLSSIEIAEYFQLQNTYYLEKLEELTLFPKILDLFRRDRSISFSIVSSNIENAIKKILTNNQIPHNRFELILGKQTGKSKIELLDKVKFLNKKKSLYIGDTYEDEMICKQLNIKFGLVEYGYTQVREVRKKNLSKTFGTASDVYDYIINS